jgi:GDPmannose 4,6-dehydratase
MWQMLQQDMPDDYVVGTGETHSVRELCQAAFGCLDMDWEQHVVVDPEFYRPAEVELLVSDPTKAQETLGWEPRVSFEELIQMMADADLAHLKQVHNL